MKMMALKIGLFSTATAVREPKVFVTYPRGSKNKGSMTKEHLMPMLNTPSTLMFPKLNSINQK
jgi:hypothetical protein